MKYLLRPLDPEPRPDKTTMGHVRKLEAELLAMKAERDCLLNIIGSAVMNNDGSTAGDDLSTYYLIRAEDYDAMGNALVAAAKGDA